jgi:uncharacterized membrane protein YhaH (DUF805 family)
MSRGNFWEWWLVLLACNFVIRVVIKDILWLSMILGLLVTAFGMIQGIKRMHDMDKSGWCVLIPIYNFILLLGAGTPGPNQYGDAPQ